MKKGSYGSRGSRPTSHVAIVDRGIANLYHCQTDLVKSNFTLKDRSALNLHAFNKEFIFGSHR